MVLCILVMSDCLLRSQNIWTSSAYLYPEECIAAALTNQCKRKHASSLSKLVSKSNGSDGQRHGFNAHVLKRI